MRVFIVGRWKTDAGGRNTLRVFDDVDRAREFVWWYQRAEEWQEDRRDRWTRGCDVMDIDGQDVLSDVMREPALSWQEYLSAVFKEAKERLTTGV